MSRTWQIAEHTAFVISAPDRVVVLNLDVPGARPRGLLGTSATIWQALCGPEDALRPEVAEDALLSDVAAAYAVDAETIADEVRTFLADLEAEGLVRSDSADERPTG